MNRILINYNNLYRYYQIELFNLKILEEKKEVLVVRPDIYKKILNEAKETTMFKEMTNGSVGYYNSISVENAPTLKEPYKFMTIQEYEEWRLQEIAKKRIGV